MRLKEIKITVHTDPIAIDAEALWRIVGPGFADVAAWTSSVKRSEGTGAPSFADAPCEGRTCHVNIRGYDTIIERLTHYDASKRELAYEVTEGVPGFVRLARNAWHIRSLEDGTSVAEMSCTLRLSPWLGLVLGGPMKRQVTRNLRVVAGELKRHAETLQLGGAERLVA